MGRVLVVEGRQDIADLLEQMLADLDFGVVVAASLNTATTEAHTQTCDLALLEANLGVIKELSGGGILAARGIPFAFISSEGTSGLDRAYWSRPVLVKPFRKQQLREVIALLNVHGSHPTS